MESVRGGGSTVSEEEGEKREGEVFFEFGGRVGGAVGFIGVAVTGGGKMSR